MAASSLLSAPAPAQIRFKGTEISDSLLLLPRLPRPPQAPSLGLDDADISGPDPVAPPDDPDGSRGGLAVALGATALGFGVGLALAWLSGLI